MFCLLGHPGLVLAKWFAFQYIFPKKLFLARLDSDLLRCLESDLILQKSRLIFLYGFYCNFFSRNCFFRQLAWGTTSGGSGQLLAAPQAAAPWVWPPSVSSGFAFPFILPKRKLRRPGASRVEFWLHALRFNAFYERKSRLPLAPPGFDSVFLGCPEPDRKFCKNPS